MAWRRRRLAPWPAVALALALGAAAAHAAITPFSAGAPGSIPAAWQPYSVRAELPPTRYELVAVDGRQVLRARASASASALIHRLDADPARTPRLSWQWRVDELVAGADLTRKAGDDFPARVYVLFDVDRARLGVAQRARRALARLVYGEEPPHAALCYVWDNRHPVGTSVPSAYTERVRVIVLESGPALLGRWVTEERDVAADYRAAFGEEPPRIVGVVVAADTDNTGAASLAFFGDLRLDAGAAR